MSGGIDSSATALAILNEGYETSGLFVDYGQPAARCEWRAARDVAHRLGIGIERIDLGFSLAAESGEFFGRNALFILAAAGTVQARPLAIALGIHALSEYYDTQPLFLRQMQGILDGYSGGSVSLSAPFLACPKAEVIEFAREHAVPLEITSSREARSASPCSQCPSCVERGDSRPI